MVLLFPTPGASGWLLYLRWAPQHCLFDLYPSVPVSRFKYVLDIIMVRMTDGTMSLDISLFGRPCLL